jgi:hypothetical protein
MDKFTKEWWNLSRIKILQRRREAAALARGGSTAATSGDDHGAGGGGEAGGDAWYLQDKPEVMVSFCVVK